jgi:hypothetical protein
LISHCSPDLLSALLLLLASVWKKKLPLVLLISSLKTSTSNWSLINLHFKKETN